MEAQPKTLDSGRDDSPAENQRLCRVFESHFWGVFWPPEFFAVFWSPAGFIA